MNKSYEVTVRVPVVSAAYRAFTIDAESPDEALRKFAEQASVDLLTDSDPKYGLSESWTDADGSPWMGPADIFCDYVRMVVDAGFDNDTLTERLRADHRVAGGYPCLDVLPF